MNDYDIVFLSFNESNADENFARLTQRFPEAIRLHRVKGLHRAVCTACIASSTDYFYLVDGDSWVLDSFDFSFDPHPLGFNTYIFQARNNVNGLVYGNGGIKLHRRQALFAQLTQASSPNNNDLLGSIDFPTTPDFKFLPIVATETRINASPFDAWKSAFRECSKLAAFMHWPDWPEQGKRDAAERLKSWQEPPEGVKYGEWVRKGALAGASYGVQNNQDKPRLELINDYDWLQRLLCGL
jgi:hypothetical protein